MITNGKIQKSELRYVESLSPGQGYAPARASGASGSIQLSLDGSGGSATARAWGI